MARLIPREVLFGNPERTLVRLSPDGKRLTYLAADQKNILQVWLRSLDGGDDRKLTAVPLRGVLSYFWSYNNEEIVYYQDAGGNEQYHMFAVNIATGATRDLTPFDGIQAQMVAAHPEFPDELLVGLNHDDPRVHDLYRIHLKEGRVEFDTKNPGNVISWVVDVSFRARAATATSPDGGYDVLFRETTAQPWKVLQHWGPEDEGSAVSFSADGKLLYTLSNRSSNTSRLVAIEPATGTETVVAEDPDYDLDGAHVHPITQNLEAVYLIRERLEWKIIDPSIADDFAALARSDEGDIRFLGRDVEDGRWLIQRMTDEQPARYYIYDRRSKAATFLFSGQPKLDQFKLAPMCSIRYDARDGLPIHSYLTLPTNDAAKNLPVILLAHGGPYTRCVWGYLNEAQWLANRGYAVLQPNFRGSTGYGKRFVNLSHREWAGKMHDDLVDGVRWLVAQGIADPKRVGIMGQSYGGYAALVGLTFTPDVFAAGVSIVGPSNLVTLMRNVPAHWTPYKKLWAKRIGDVETEEEFLKSRSPAFFVDRIQSPLLVVQGANDPRVTRVESEQIVEAMRSRGKPIEYLLFPDEGHFIARQENRLHVYARIEAFLAKHLGGHCESVTPGRAPV